MKNTNLLSDVMPPVLLGPGGDYQRPDWCGLDTSSNDEGIQPGEHLITRVAGRVCLVRMQHALDGGRARVTHRDPILQVDNVFEVRLSECFVLRSGMTLYRAFPRENATRQCVFISVDHTHITLQYADSEDRVQVTYANFVNWCFATRRQARNALRDWRSRRHEADALVVGANST